MFSLLWVVAVVVLALIVYARWNRGLLEGLRIPLESSHWLLGSNPNFHTDFHHKIELERNSRLGKVHGVRVFTKEVFEAQILLAILR